MTAVLRSSVSLWMAASSSQMRSCKQPMRSSPAELIASISSARACASACWTTALVELPRPAPAPKLRAQYRNLDPSATDGQIRPGLQVVNTGTAPVALSRVTLRYWFTKDSGPGVLRPQCEWAQLGCERATQRVVSLGTPRPGADRYLEVGFKPSAGSLGAGASTGPVQCRVQRSDRSRFIESNDYSWAPAQGGYADTVRVTVYLDGVLVAGTEP